MTTLDSLLQISPAFLAADFMTPVFAAYLDPGTGSMIIQLLLGGIASAMVVVKLYWHRIKGFFSRKESASPVQNQDD